eukprot:TRINITY_DN2276_c0_g1_i2.p1 TRINITY_DN2276_c0_g1~~TRINITY_DN2276_c0_g1_i2.p1  ORF type:complete len:748 (-),score=152.51 TRINITY_DN2276_c0_g1_i2:90-2333(-)
MTSEKKKTLQALIGNFMRDVRDSSLVVSRWMVQMESAPSQLKNKSSLLTRGLFLAQAVSELVKRYLYLHFSLQFPINPAHLPSIFQCIEMLKGIRAIYHRRLPEVAEATSFITRKIAHQMQQLLSPIYQKLNESLLKKKAGNAAIDAISSVELALQMLNGPPTRTRAIVFQIAYYQIPVDLIPQGNEDAILIRLTQLDNLANLGSYLDKACDCSLLYWAKALVPLYLQSIYNNPLSAKKLIYFFAGLRDIIPVFHKSVHVPTAELLDAFNVEIDQSIKDNLVLKLCHEIHQDLAEHVHHSTKNLDVSRKLASGPFGHRDVSPFLSLRPLYFYNSSIDIKSMVTHFLDRSFYNLNTVALYDWATFGEMRSLALDKYGLVLKEVHLPGQTLEQGLDVLEIMRKLNSFVINYRYNLNNQIFIEATSENNTLNVISVQHIANSIRTHGTGIMNTTVSVTYQFLLDQLHRFATFLFDEMIKSRLLRDLHTFSELKKENTSDQTTVVCYQVATAKKLQEYIKNLGLTPDKKTYLVKFKELITKIGNAMGYVRMIRSGGLLFTANAIQFVPDLNEISDFKEMFEADGLVGPDVISAAHNLDSVVDTLSQNFSEGSEYFKMLENVFAAQYRRPENSFLQTFYMIIPALTLQYIEDVVKEKEKFCKKGRETGTFTDDGFALGIVYLLKLLDLNKEFDSLHWFDSAIQFYTKEIESNKREKENIKISQLTKNKLLGDLKELELLQWTFYSARILFHD